MDDVKVTFKDYIKKEKETEISYTNIESYPEQILHIKYERGQREQTRHISLNLSPPAQYHPNKIVYVVLEVQRLM